MSPQVLTVIGATGIQGSSVVNAALRYPEKWHVRAITRNPSSEAAQALAAQHVEVVKADLNDLASLKVVFKDSHAIFAATDFFGPFSALGADVEKAKEIEWNQVKNIIEAAEGCETMQHLIWSTLPHATRISGGKLHPAHFEAKNRGEDVIRGKTGLLAKTTFALVGWYASNFVYPSFKPAWMETANTHIQVAPVPADVPLFTIGDPKANIGVFILAILNHPRETLPGRSVHVAIEETSMGKLLEDWEIVTGKSAVYVQCSMEEYDALWPGWGKVEGDMLMFYDECRGKPWVDEGENMVSAEELGVRVEEMVSVRDAVKRL